MLPESYADHDPRHLWYKDALVYSLDVESFQDGNGDGIGDFRGLLDRLDYLDGLGINCLWLLPFYPTPNRDNGYDVTDYYSVDPRLGTAGEFVEFMRAATERGIRVLIDLPVNHTSNQHPWFQEARSDPESRYHDYYVWSDERPESAESGMVFPGVQEEIWSYDRTARKYYLHRFYRHQPDLNIANPEVRAEIMRIMGFWAELGVSGFRLDAAPFLIELKGIEGPEGVDPHSYLREFRSYLSWTRGDAMLLAEANVDPDRIGEYFGPGPRMHMLFNFLVNQHLFLAMARQDRTSLVKAIHMTPGIPAEAQWAHFLRNHDELDLARLTDLQRETVFEAFAPEERMQLYGRGIRRRLAPMLGGDARRIRLAHSLLFTLPGTPVLRYGEEIGMGDDLSLDERDAVRTVMQWSDGPNGGFSSADPDDLPRPAISGGPYGFEELNVEAQERDPDSLLNWMEHALRTRKRCPEFGRGQLTVLETDDAAVFAHSASMGQRRSVAVHNLSDRDVRARVDLSGLAVDGDSGDCLRDLLGGHRTLAFEPDFEIELEPFGFRWYQVE